MSTVRHNIMDLFHRNREKKEKWINLEMTVELINCKPAHASVPRGEHPSKFKFLLQSRCSEEVLKFVFQTAIWETSHDFNNRFFYVRPRHRQAQLWASRLLAAMSYSLLLVRMEIHAASFDQWQIPCSLADVVIRSQTVSWFGSLDARQLDIKEEQKWAR